MMETTDSLSEFSKCWLLLQKAHEKEINAVTEVVEKWKRRYETERDLVSSLQTQLNVEVEPRVEQLKKLLSIAEAKIAEKEAKIVEKDQEISNLESLIRTDMENQANKSNCVSVQHMESQTNDFPPILQVDGGSENASPSSPSLLVNADPLSSRTTPNKNLSNTVDHKLTKRKRRKRLKQMTLTQHQGMDDKRQKLDNSVKVIPQSPVIDLSTIQSDSSCEENEPGLVSDDVSDEYVTGNENTNSQNSVATNQGHTFDHNNKTELTFVPNSSLSCGTGNQDLSTIGHRQHNVNQDNTFVDNVASQACNLLSQNCDLDRTFVPGVINGIQKQDFAQNANKESTNPTHNATNKQLKDLRDLKRAELRRSTSDPKCVVTCRKKSDRNKLDAAPCHECAQWYSGDEDFQNAKKACRHRFKDPRPDTPPAFWDIGFPDTAES